MKNSKRILSVQIKRMVDESPDTSWLGEYANRATSEFSIDRAHSEDCESLIPDTGERPDLPHEEDCTYRLSNGLSECSCDKDSTPHECTCDERGDMERGQYRYFNPGSVEKFNPNNQWLAKYPAEERKDVWQKTMRQNAKSDYERMESLNRGDFCFIGIRAEAQVAIADVPAKGIGYGAVIQHITSGGLWGIESDSDKKYLTSVEKDELSDLRAQLKALGFSSRAISAAFKKIEREDA